LTGASFFDLFLFLVLCFKVTISSRNWRHLVCIIIASLELSLVELVDQLPHTCSKCVLLMKTR
jgi:hypothetical protein